MLAFFKFALLARQKAVTVGGDLVFATSTPLTIAIPAVYAKKKLGVPLVFEVRDLWPELPIAVGAIKSPILKWLSKKLEKYAYFNSEHVVGLSPGMSQGIVNTGYPAKNVSTIPNSCDLELFDPASNDGALFRKKYDWLGDRPLVIYAGTLGQINGVSYLARLAEEIYELDPEIRFAVIGAGVDEKKVRDVAEELGVLNKNFFMLKNIAKKEMPSVFSAATVSTSLFIDLREMWANSANKFFDTLAAGKPVVINYGGWQAEIVERDRLGLVLDPKPDSEAARRLVDLIRSKSLQEEFSLNARAKAESSFSRDILARKLICTLEQVYEENL